MKDILTSRKEKEHAPVSTRNDTLAVVDKELKPVHTPQAVVKNIEETVDNIQASSRDTQGDSNEQQADVKQTLTSRKEEEQAVVSPCNDTQAHVDKEQETVHTRQEETNDTHAIVKEKLQLVEADDEIDKEMLKALAGVLDGSDDEDEDDELEARARLRAQQRFNKKQLLQASTKNSLTENDNTQQGANHMSKTPKEQHNTRPQDDKPWWDDYEEEFGIPEIVRQEEARRRKFKESIENGTAPHLIHNRANKPEPVKTTTSPPLTNDQILGMLEVRLLDKDFADEVLALIHSIHGVSSLC